MKATEVMLGTVPALAAIALNCTARGGSRAKPGDRGGKCRRKFVAA